MFPEIDIGPEIIQAVQVVLAVLIAYYAAFSLSLVIWAVQDIRRRSQDWMAQFLAFMLVLLFNLPGLLLYLLLRPGETLAMQYERSLEEAAILQDLDKQLACPACKRAIQDDFLMCPHCMAVLKHSCRSCGRPLHSQWKTCPYCATPVAPEPAVAVEATGGPSDPALREPNLRR